MYHYKSWSGLSKWLWLNICDELKWRVTFFLTRYHEVHNSYGRAAIRLDGKEMVCFSWDARIAREYEIPDSHSANTIFDGIKESPKPERDAKCTYCEMDFLDAVLRYRSMNVHDALDSEDFIIKVLAIMDKRVGKRTLSKIEAEREYEYYPEWVRQFYELRLFNGKTQ